MRFEGLPDTLEPGRFLSRFCGQPTAVRGVVWRHDSVTGSARTGLLRPLTRWLVLNSIALIPTLLAAAYAIWPNVPKYAASPDVDRRLIRGDLVTLARSFPCHAIILPLRGGTPIGDRATSIDDPGVRGIPHLLLVTSSTKTGRSRIEPLRGGERDARLRPEPRAVAPKTQPSAHSSATQTAKLHGNRPL